MGTCAQIYKLTLLIKADLGTFWQILDQFYLVRLIFFLKISNCFFSWLCKACNRQCFFYHLFHLSFDLCKIICLDRCLTVNIIIKSLCNRRSDRQLHIRIQSFQCLSQDMGCCMTKCSFSAFILKCKNAELTVFINNCSKIDNLSVQFSCTGNSGKSFTDVGSNLNNRLWFGIFFFGSIF